MPQKIAIPSAEFIRNIGRWQNEALRQPIVITHHGRDRLVLAAPDLLRDASNQNEGDAGGSDAVALRTAHAALVENIQEGCLALDARGAIQSANPIATAYLGRSDADMRGHGVIDVFPELLALLMHDRVQRVLRTRRPESFETASADGRAIAVRVFPTGEGATILFHNTTEQRRLQQQDEESSAVLGALAQLGSAALLRLDARGRVETADARFSDWSGFNASEIAGHRLADLMPPADRRRFNLLFEQVLRDVRPGRDTLIVLGRRGDELCVDAAIAPIQSDYVARGAVIMLTRSAEAPARYGDGRGS